MPDTGSTVRNVGFWLTACPPPSQLDRQGYGSLPDRKPPNFRVVTTTVPASCLLSLPFKLQWQNCPSCVSHAVWKKILQGLPTQSSPDGADSGTMVVIDHLYLSTCTHPRFRPVAAFACLLVCLQLLHVFSSADSVAHLLHTLSVLICIHNIFVRPERFLNAGRVTLSNALRHDFHPAHFCSRAQLCLPTTLSPLSNPRSSSTANILHCTISGESDTDVSQHSAPKPYPFFSSSLPDCTPSKQQVAPKREEVNSNHANPSRRGCLLRLYRGSATSRE